MEPTIGRVVHYRVKKEDLDRLQDQGKGTMFSIPSDDQPAGVTYGIKFPFGNDLKIGDTVPLTVVRPWHQPGMYDKGTSVLNGVAFTDGPHLLWVLSVPEGEGPGTWSWPPRA